MILVVDPADELAERLAGVRPETGVKHVLDLGAAERHLEGHRWETTVVVTGPGIEVSEALDICTKLNEAHPELSIVICPLGDSTGLLRSAMRAGATDVLPWDAAIDEVRDVIQRASRNTLRLREAEKDAALHGGSETVGTILTTFSTKGGCGKSLVATSLATLLVQEAPDEVVLVDLDLEGGDDAVMLQLLPERGILEAAEMGASLDESALQAFLTKHESGLRVLTAPTHPKYADEISADAVGHILRLLRSMYRWVVVDGPPAFTDQILAALDLTDVVVVITSMDVPSIKNLKLSVETLRELGFPRDQMRLVLNRADSKVGLTIREVERSLDTEIDATLPSSREVPFAINQGVPVVLSRPKAPIARSLGELLESVRPSPPKAAEGHHTWSARRQRRS
jgi:pilus assembly protein CpaE